MDKTKCDLIQLDLDDPVFSFLKRYFKKNVVAHAILKNGLWDFQYVINDIYVVSIHFLSHAFRCRVILKDSGYPIADFLVPEEYKNFKALLDIFLKDMTENLKTALILFQNGYDDYKSYLPTID